MQFSNEPARQRLTIAAWNRWEIYDAVRYFINGTGLRAQPGIVEN